MTYVVAILLVAAALIAALVWQGARRWRREIDRLRARMGPAPAAAEGPTALDVDDLEGVPAPVQRYFRAVLREGQPAISTVLVEQSGSFDMGLGTGAGDRENWKPFRAEQTVWAQGRGFVWDARIYVAPRLAAHVCDAYVDGEGLLVGKVLGLVNVAEHRGTADVAEGELMRFFAEAVWYPTALWPGDHVRWEPVDDRTARAFFTDRECTFSAVFHFDDEDLIRRVEMNRLRLEGNDSVRTPWIGRFFDYQRHAGMLVPVRGEVCWGLPGGPRPYWRGRLTRLEYQMTDGSATVTAGS